MLKGNPKYFACNFNIDLVMGAKYNGEPYPPLISKNKVEAIMADNREKGLRELYNKFSADSHEGQIITRRDLMSCTRPVPPVLANPDGSHQYIMAWDSARLNDNSTVGIADIYNDPEKGWCMDIVNFANFVDIKTKRKTPMTMPEQLEAFKKLLIDYNGNEFRKLDYENIMAVVCDSGAGGQMVGGISDYLLADWEDSHGHRHKGLIDRSHKANETARSKFPDAVDIMKLVDPRAHRNEIFDAAERMVKLGVVTFPADYDDKGYIQTIDDNGEEHIRHLSSDEMLSLAQISRVKDEIVMMCKYINGGTVSYNYPPDKRNKEHDDRVFTFALLCWYLAGLRRGQARERKKEDVSYKDMFHFRRPRCK